MHFQFLIEDHSGEILVRAIIKKIMTGNPTITVDYKSFKGIGGFTKRNTVRETKDGKLLNDLATYMRGFNKSLQKIDAALFVVLDNDKRDPGVFRKELQDVAQKNNITIDHVFCIAVEEMEAWLMGDENAVKTAYPSVKLRILHSYVQDSICDTWEKLADAVYPGGYDKLKKECPTYMEIGKCKSEWAEKIGRHIDLRNNKSPSFNAFCSEITQRLS